MTIKPGQNTISLDGDGVPHRRLGLDRRLPPQPRARRTARSRRSTSSTCTTRSGSSTASRRSPPARRRPNSRCRRASAGATRRVRPLGAQPHDPQPDADDRDRSTSRCTLDFIPDTSPAAKGITEVKTRWIDVQGGKPYPVFDVAARQRAKGGRFTYPDDVPGRLRQGGARAQPLDRSTTTARSSQTAGHLHPGRPVHRPQAHARRAQGQPLPLQRALLRAGGRGLVGRRDDGDATEVARRGQEGRRAQSIIGDLRHQARRRGTSRWGSCRWRSRTVAAGGVDPFTRQSTGAGAEPRPPARERQPRRRAQAGAPEPAAAARRPATSTRSRSTTSLYGQGDLLRRPATPARPPRRAAARRSRSSTVDRDPELSDLPHVTALQGALQQDRRASGSRSPTAGRRSTPASSASARRDFDAAARQNRDTWPTPQDVAAARGTYTYFCRVHPFMRGAFRVKK